jgi:hypothetical protein
VDSRQATLFGAAWTLGSIGSLSLAGASSMTIHETFGWRGVLERKEGSPLPEKFPSVAGGVFPLHHVLADVLELGGGRAAALSTPDPLVAGGLGIERDGLRRILVANFTTDPRRIVLHVPAWRPAREARVRVLDASRVPRALSDPEGFRLDPGGSLAFREGRLELELGAHAVARIDLR